MISEQSFVVTVQTRKPIAALADQIGNRLWTMDGVVSAVAIQQGDCPAQIRPILPAHLETEAKAYGASMSHDSIEHGDAA